MFDRFIRLARARKALQEKRFEDALQLADDPLIAGTRRAETIRDKARAALLARARERLAQGEIPAARKLAERLRQAGADAGVQTLIGDLDAAESREQEVSTEARKVADEARKLLQRGELAAAAAAVAGMPEGGPAGLQRQLEAQVKESKLQAKEQLDHVARHLAQRRVDEAQKAFAKAAALDRDAAANATVRGRLFDALADGAGGRIREQIERGDLLAACAAVRAVRGQAATFEIGQAVGDVRALKKPLSGLESALVAEWRRATDITAAAELAEAAHEAGLELPAATAELVAALRTVHATGEGDPEPLQKLRGVARTAGCKSLVKAVDGRLLRLDDQDQRVTAARELMAQGDLDAARERLTAVLADDPLHEAARRELDLVEQGIGSLSEQLTAARTAAREGRLRAACSQALALGTAGRLGNEAQLLLTDVRARMALVDRGLDEVRTTLHGKAAGSLQGVRHCLARLEELRKVQCDHDELDRVVLAIETEIQGLEACDRAAAALADDDLVTAAASLSEVLGSRRDLLVPERLDARVLTLADRFHAHGERALAAGRGGDLERCAAVLDGLAAVKSDFGETAAHWRRDAERRKQAADDKAAAARAAIAERDLATAEQCLEDATELWADCAAVRTLQGELAGHQRRHNELEQVEALAAEADYQGAAEKLAAMPPTPALLRTRIFDMKQQLARAQGLEGAFLMRVDEGGEHLVVRGESISIGNVRQNRADLPVLANVAGRHATIRRSMSFHGGMEDTVVAEDGEVRVRGRRVRQHKLQDGDTIQFGPSLAASYRQPTERSLTAGLVLQGGFQIAGTERVLLMKDRGKDGRILVGPGRDVHVRVAGASHEVELFAASTGQIRVHCPAGGTIDGSPFKGEHPVDAGQVVTAGGVTFVLLPWRPSP